VSLKLLKRVVAEKRALVLPLAAGFVVTLLLYVGGVYPLSAKVAADLERADAAERQLRAAEAGYAGAQATQAGTAQAREALQKFYTEVLPSDLSGARRITYLRLAQLAERANLRFERRSVIPERDRQSRLTKLRMTMILAGDYRDVRQFIYQLETSPEFVVIDDVALAQNQERNASLVLTLEVSTYYRTDGDGL